MKFHKNRLEHLKKLFIPKTILDIGAHEGTWGVVAKEVFPKSNIHMIEGNPNKTDILKSIDIPFTICLLGKENNESVSYYMTKHDVDTGNSIYRENSVFFEDKNCKKVQLPMKTLDTLMAEEDITNVNFIKMDEMVERLQLETANKEKRVVDCRPKT